MDGTVREGLSLGRMRQACRLWTAAGMMTVTLSVPLLAAEPVASRASERPPARRPKVDHAVMPAGGAASRPAKCTHCQRSACPQCRLAEGHHHGHAQCQHGLCPAHCPVRPDVFGFYGTKWRQWPGAAVVQASNNEAATPVRPPRAEVPGVEEESLPPAASEMEPTAAMRPAVAPAREDAVLENTVGERDNVAETVLEVETVVEGEAVVEDGAREDRVEAAVSSTAWRTFTTTPPRLAVQP